MSSEAAVRDVKKVKKDEKEKKDKKDKKSKKDKSVVETDASAAPVEASLPSDEPTVSAIVEDVDRTLNGADGDEQSSKKSKKDKKAKKDKKRKLQAEQEDIEEPSSTSAVDANAQTPAVESAEATSTTEDGSKKKKRKKNVQGAFGNDPKKQKSAAVDDSPAPAATASISSSNLSQAQIDAFVAESDLTYEPSTSSSTYPPVLSFDTLPVAAGIKAGLTGFAKPTIVQSASWGVQLTADKNTRPKDIVSIAATGSGKTLAFGVPILHHIQHLPAKQSRSIAALIVAPTRELAMQTQNNLENIGKSMGMGVVCIYGGAPKHEQKRLLSQGPRIVVGTPGRILDLCNEGALDLSSVSWLVLDEADRMLDKGFENDIRSIISQCKPSNGSVDGRITSMFSATWPMSVRRLANDFMIDPVRVTVGSDELSASTSVAQSVIVLPDSRSKDGKLLDVLRSEGFQSSRAGGGWGGKNNANSKQRAGPDTGAQREKVLVFALYKKEAARVAGWLERHGYEVGCIQGDLSQDKRTQALDDFRNGRTVALVATDVAARGLDIPKVELVVNYTFPLTVEDYVHRIGRTGRAGRKGKSITFFTEEDKAHAGELQRVLRDAGQEVPDSLAAFGGTIKKKSHAAYGDHFREIDPNIKAKKITFD